MMNFKKEYVKKKVWFTDVKQPSEAGMMCTVDKDTFFLFMKNMWIGDSGALCPITNDRTFLLDIIDIDESIQGRSRNMPVPKNGNFTSMTKS